MDSRFRYEVSHVVMNCRDPQKSLRALRALGAPGEAGETSTCCIYLSDFPILHNCLLGPIFNRPLWALPLLNQIGHCQSTTLRIRLHTFLMHLRCISEALLHTLMHCISDSACYTTPHCPLHLHLHTCHLHLFVCLFTFVTGACVACFVCLFPLLDWFC